MPTKSKPASGAGHTPGPWEVAEAGHPRALGVSPGTLVYAPGTDWNVALCEWGGTFPGEVEEARANAALIARAPDLLAEVQRLRGALAVLLRRYTFHEQDEEQARAALGGAK